VALVAGLATTATAASSPSNLNASLYPADEVPFTLSRSPLAAAKRAVVDDVNWRRERVAAVGRNDDDDDDTAAAGGRRPKDNVPGAHSANTAAAFIPSFVHRGSLLDKASRGVEAPHHVTTWPILPKLENQTVPKQVGLGFKLPQQATG
jgi:hypothetical protein